MSDGNSGRPFVTGIPKNGCSTTPIELRVFGVKGLLSSFDRSSFLTTRSARVLRSTENPNTVYIRLTVRFTTTPVYHRGCYKVYYEVYVRGCSKVYYTGY